MAVVGSLLLAACGVNTTDSVAPPSAQPPASSPAPRPPTASAAPQPQGASPAGRGLGSGDETTTYTSFAGPVRISLTEKHGFSSVVGEELDDGGAGIKLRITGPARE